MIYRFENVKKDGPILGCPPISALTTTNAARSDEMAIPTQARAREYYNYDPESGSLTFRERPASEFSAPRYISHLKTVGSVAGSREKDGYIRVHIDGSYHRAHRVAWLIMTGEWVKYPDFEIDHINGKRDDNRWRNLRKVTKSENQRNAGKRNNNSSGVHGVNWKPKYNQNPEDGRWVARIWNGPRHVYLGAFKTVEEAKIARRAAERVLGFTDVERRRS